MRTPHEQALILHLSTTLIPKRGPLRSLRVDDVVALMDHLPPESIPLIVHNLNLPVFEHHDEWEAGCTYDLYTVSGRSHIVKVFGTGEDTSPTDGYDRAVDAVCINDDCVWAAPQYYSPDEIDAALDEARDHIRANPHSQP